MLEPWNDLSLRPPPILTASSSINGRDIEELRRVCNNIMKVLNTQSPLHKESAVVSRFLYKFDKKFRNDIGYKNLKKVNTALHRYLKLNVSKDVDNFLSAIPNESGDTCLPTCQMLEYVLIRLMSFSKIMLRIYVCSKQAAVFYMHRIKRGESHWMSLMPYALLSRVWSISSVLLQHCNTWYSKMHSFLSKLQYKGLHFLHVNYNLPKNLDKWLELENIESFGKFTWAQNHVEHDLSIVYDDDDKDSMEMILGYVNQVNNNENKSNTEIPYIQEQSTQKLQTQPIQDQGEAISRESYILKTMGNIMKTKCRSESSHTYKNIYNTQDLQKFIIREETFRNDSSQQALTTHLSLMQWHALKKSLIKLSSSLSESRKIEKKFQKIWKEKCLDYI